MFLPFLGFGIGLIQFNIKINVTKFALLNTNLLCHVFVRRIQHMRVSLSFFRVYVYGITYLN